MRFCHEDVTREASAVLSHVASVGCHASFFNKHGGKKNYLAGRLNPTSSCYVAVDVGCTESGTDNDWGQVLVSGLVYFKAQ